MMVVGTIPASLTYRFHGGGPADASWNQTTVLPAMWLEPSPTGTPMPTPLPTAAPMPPPLPIVAPPKPKLKVGGGVLASGGLSIDCGGNAAPSGFTIHACSS